LRFSRRETLNLLVCVYKSLSETSEKLTKIEEDLILKLGTDEWDNEEAKNGDTITYLNNSNYENIYSLVLKHFIAEASAQEIWEDVYYMFPNIKDYDADDLTNEIVNLNFDDFTINQGDRFSRLYIEYMKNIEE